MDARPPSAPDTEPTLRFELRVLSRAAGRPWSAELRLIDFAPAQRFDSPLELLRYLEQAAEPARRPGHLR